MAPLDQGQTKAAVGRNIRAGRRAISWLEVAGHSVSGEVGVETHEIRLRGGWESITVVGRDEGPTRLTLPAPADSLPAGRIRLTRRFRRPPRAAGDPAIVRFSRSPGIRSITFNGRPIGPPSPGAPEFELGLGPLEPRNELEIEAEPPRDEPEWGAISLVFLT